MDFIKRVRVKNSLINAEEFLNDKPQEFEAWRQNQWVQFHILTAESQLRFEDIKLSGLVSIENAITDVHLQKMAVNAYWETKQAGAVDIQNTAGKMGSALEKLIDNHEMTRSWKTETQEDIKRRKFQDLLNYSYLSYADHLKWAKVIFVLRAAARAEYICHWTGFFDEKHEDIEKDAELFPSRIADLRKKFHLLNEATDSAQLDGRLFPPTKMNIPDYIEKDYLESKKLSGKLKAYIVEPVPREKFLNSISGAPQTIELLERDGQLFTLYGRRVV